AGGVSPVGGDGGGQADDQVGCGADLCQHRPIRRNDLHGGHAAALRLNIHRHRLPGGRGEQPVVRDSSVIERGGVRLTGGDLKGKRVDRVIRAGRPRRRGGGRVQQRLGGGDGCRFQREEFRPALRQLLGEVGCPGFGGRRQGSCSGFERRPEGGQLDFQRGADL